jgi:3-dehydroquinate synthase
MSTISVLKTGSPGSLIQDFLASHKQQAPFAIFIDDKVALESLDLQSIRPQPIKVHIHYIRTSEASKTLSTYKKIVDFCLKAGLNRQSTLIAIGGGVLLDLVGFVAATFYRGISWIAVPTTLLAAVDASIGGKTAVHVRDYKNCIGAFHEPVATLTWCPFFLTLDSIQIQSALAEVFKMAILYDKPFFCWLQIKRKQWAKKKLTLKELERIIAFCQTKKQEVIQLDLYEKNNQRIFLNFGHTLGHALEATTKFKGLTHGLAVGLGMRAAAFISQELEFLSKKNFHIIDQALQSYQWPHDLRLSFSQIFKTLQHDKKVSHGKIQWILLKDFEKPFLYDKISPQTLQKTLTFLSETFL